MQSDRASVTALGAAGLRAAHQTIDAGRIFLDPFAGPLFEAARRLHGEVDTFDGEQRSLRFFIAARSRFPEDRLAEAVGRGISQVVVLGAGLDTFSIRNPHASVGLRVFEVDHPDTQAFKRAALSAAGIAEPGGAVYVAVDFETDDLLTRLIDTEFDSSLRTFWMWLGVLPYLRRSAIEAIFRTVGGLSRSEITFDYIEPIDTYADERRQHVQATAARVAACGEPWISAFAPSDLHELLRRHGFADIDDLDIGAIATQFFKTPPGKVAGGPGPHLLHCRRTG